MTKDSRAKGDLIAVRRCVTAILCPFHRRFQKPADDVLGELAASNPEDSRVPLRTSDAERQFSNTVEGDSCSSSSLPALTEDWAPQPTTSCYSGHPLLETRGSVLGLCRTRKLCDLCKTALRPCAMRWRCEFKCGSGVCNVCYKQLLTSRSTAELSLSSFGGLDCMDDFMSIRDNVQTQMTEHDVTVMSSVDDQCQINVYIQVGEAAPPTVASLRTQIAMGTSAFLQKITNLSCYLENHLSAHSSDETSGLQSLGHDAAHTPRGEDDMYSLQVGGASCSADRSKDAPQRSMLQLARNSRLLRALHWRSNGDLRDCQPFGPDSSLAGFLSDFNSEPLSITGENLELRFVRKGETRGPNEDVTEGIACKGNCSEQDASSRLALISKDAALDAEGTAVDLLAHLLEEARTENDSLREKMQLLEHEMSSLASSGNPQDSLVDPAQTSASCATDANSTVNSEEACAASFSSSSEAGQGALRTGAATSSLPAQEAPASVDSSSSTAVEKSGSALDAGNKQNSEGAPSHSASSCLTEQHKSLGASPDTNSPVLAEGASVSTAPSSSAEANEQSDSASVVSSSIDTEGPAATPSPAEGNSKVSAPAVKGKGKGKGKGPKGPKEPVPAQSSSSDAESSGESVQEAVPASQAKGKGKGPKGPGPGSGPANHGKGKGKGKQAKGPTKASIEHAQDMKSLPWTRFVMGSHLPEDEETIWSRVKEADEKDGFLGVIPVEELEKRFSKTTGTQKVEKADPEKSEAKKSKAARIDGITSEQRFQIEVSLRTLPARLNNSSKAVKAILDLDAAAMPTECIHGLHRFLCPSEQQEEELRAKQEACQHEYDLKLAEWKQAGEPQDQVPELPQWDPVEQYMLGLMQIPGCELRLATWGFLCQLPDRIAVLKANSDKVEAMIRCFSQAQELPTLLGLILAFGNYLNGGKNQKRLGQADGFHLEALGRPGGLDVVNDPQGQNVRQLIFKVYFEKFPERASRLLEELAPLFNLVKRRVGKSDGVPAITKDVYVQLEDLDKQVSQLSTFRCHAQKNGGWSAAP